MKVKLMAAAVGIIAFLAGAGIYSYIVEQLPIEFHGGYSHSEHGVTIDALQHSGETG